MQTLTFVTGNPGKLAEWQRLFPAEFKLEATDIDLDEIQSLDLTEIAADKARRAYAMVQKPVIVEDISAGLDKLGGLPGPFIKYFEQRLGRDALFQLADQEGDPVTVVCTIAYYDGHDLITVNATVKGSVAAARGEHGFGFDQCFILAGQTKTYGEMEPSEKDSVSHRAIAVKKLVAKLRSQKL
jgi:non-canonical purine NTP pyrophosphatase (RdgB/HAM1 family)